MPDTWFLEDCLCSHCCRQRGAQVYNIWYVKTKTLKKVSLWEAVLILDVNTYRNCIGHYVACRSNCDVNCTFVNVTYRIAQKIGGNYIWRRDHLSSHSSMRLSHKTSYGSPPCSPHNRDNPLSTYFNLFWTSMWVSVSWSSQDEGVYSWQLRGEIDCTDI